MGRRPYIVGNWKMNGNRQTLLEARAIDRASQRYMKVEVALAPPFTLIHAVHREAEQIGVGAQDCHPEPDGAHTGDISAVMLSDAGAQFVIIGHSERRIDHGEGKDLIRRKLDAAFAAGLKVILCCGESQDVRAAGSAQDFVLQQLRDVLPDARTLNETSPLQDELTIAYEPIWAIGTGATASVEDIATMHHAIRSLLVDLYGDDAGENMRILYGGSVKPDNARDILAIENVDGALVGGASLQAESFLGIVLAASEAEQ